MNTSLNKTRKSVSKAYESQQGIDWQLVVLVVLFLSVLFVAIKTVVHRHQSRALFMELQVLEKNRDKLVARWSRLKLEQATMLNQIRVERMARRDLGMQIPKATEIKMVREILKLNVKPMKLNKISTKVALGG